MRLGFIGTGNMGRILIEAFLNSPEIEASQVCAHNRTNEKAERLASLYPGMQALNSNAEVVRSADIIMLCVKPLEFKRVMDEISPLLRENQIVISITSPVRLSDLEKMLQAKIAKVIPSITNSVHSGASLMIFGRRLHKEDREQIYRLFSLISTPVYVDDDHIRAASDIVSCGPAFIAYLLQRMIDAAEEETGMPREKATGLMTQMIIGLGEMFAQEKYTLQSLQEKVCVPGGVTGAGISSLDEHVGDLFHALFRRTHDKHREDQKLLEELFWEKTEQ